MAMDLQQRVSALDRDSAFTRKVIGALSKHAKWVLRSGSQPDGHAALATAVLNVPDGWAYRFGIAALTEPIYDSVEEADAILDETLQGTIAELWGLFAIEFALTAQA